MKIASYFGACLLCVTIAGCGGGEDQRDPRAANEAALSALDHAAATSPPTTAHAGRKRALTYSADLAAQLFTLAESSYASYFPSKQITRSFNGWSYRYYPEAKTYLAVIDSGVFVLGGEFGPEAVKVGEVTDFVKSTATGKDRPLTASILAQCPDASTSTSPNFYKCMVGYLEGSQTFDPSKSCRLEIAEAGVFTLSSDGKAVTAGPAFGFTIYSKIASISLINFKVEADEPEAFVDTIGAKSSSGFSLTAGGTIDVEATPKGSSTASISCRLNVPK